MTRVDLITGFLGAGKTTFLQGYTSWLRRQGVSFSLIENEYGAAGVDGAILRAGGTDSVELSGGCICCTLKTGFLDQVLALAGQTDRILVEPSGIYDVSQFYAVMRSPSLTGICEIGHIFTIVSAQEDDRSLPQEALVLLRSQLLAADQILLSKADTCTQEDLVEWRETLCRLSGHPELPFGFAGDLRFMDDCVFQFLWADTARAVGGLEPIPNHSALFQSIIVRPQRTFHLDEAEALAPKLFSRSGILRVKGWLNHAGGGSLLINFALGSCSVTKDSCAHPPAVNVIGNNLNRLEITDTFT